MMGEPKILITRKEYDELVERSDWLRYLEWAGVDNWDGYHYAYELKEEEEAKND